MRLKCPLERLKIKLWFLDVRINLWLWPFQWSPPTLFFFNTQNRDTWSICRNIKQTIKVIAYLRGHGILHSNFPPLSLSQCCLHSAANIIITWIVSKFFLSIIGQKRKSWKIKHPQYTMQRESPFALRFFRPSLWGGNKHHR